ncbi:COP9 signalosome complex subunit 5 [Rhodotorula toruloides]|uniref:COP9 signalosome complex subunit 5 n=1 Tax=Rhodotorula toruloides TaxID=5286 RepID=A0A511KK96_RHOTO|nr:COP9 signalosome complex subunit 5 [Rhodotorula toruloides]
MATSSESVAQASFNLANNIQETDEVFKYDKQGQQDQLKARPWRQDPHHFKKVRISAVALIKMVMHARSGGQYEIMGLMQGKLDGDTFVVMDAFALPVVGTETRVNAANEANEFMIQYIESSPAIGRPENIVGWYHSHPGYGCWLSGIDVMTQKTNQQFQDPFLAVVIDPNRTVSAGRVEIGAFRTYPDGYTPPNASTSEYQSIPVDKIEDFGVHANSYYPLEVSHFKSTHDTQLLDLLWNKYWVMTLSQSPLVSNRAYATSQLSDLVAKLRNTETSVSHRCNISHMSPLIVQIRQHLTSSKEAGNGKGKGKATGEHADEGGVVGKKAEVTETPLARVVKDSSKMAGEASNGLIGALVKDALFNGGKLSQAGVVQATGEGGPLVLPPVVS